MSDDSKSWPEFEAVNEWADALVSEPVFGERVFRIEQSDRLKLAESVSKYRKSIEIVVNQLEAQRTVDDDRLVMRIDDPSQEGWLHETAKTAALNASKNASTDEHHVAPQLLYAPILWAMQDAMPAPRVTIKGGNPETLKNLRAAIEKMKVNPHSQLIVEADEPISMLLACPVCGERHIDEGEFATKPHHTHACQDCGMVWRPALVDTVGVRFLPGFKDEPVKQCAYDECTNGVADAHAPFCSAAHSEAVPEEWLCTNCGEDAGPNICANCR